MTARLRQLGDTTGWGPQDAARAFALQQFSSRLFRSDSAENWVVVGGTALQYRSAEARPTTDIDLAFAADAALLRESLMRALAPADGGEYGVFALTLRESAERGQHTARIAYLVDGQRLANATLDVNTSRPIDFVPDTLTPTALVTMPDLAAPPSMRVYPVARHLADKVTAMYERHGASGAAPSTRPHDLADIVILARSSTVDAGELLGAVREQERRRGVVVPCPLTLPTGRWVQTYPGRIERSGLPAPLHDALAALAAANEFLYPVLAGKVHTGRWDPTTQNWKSGGHRGDQSSIGELLRAAQPERAVTPPRYGSEVPEQHSQHLDYGATPDTGTSLD